MYSQSTKDQFVKLYKMLHGHIQRTCDSVQVDRSTYYLWRKEDSKFRQAIEDVEEGFLDSAEACLRGAIDDEDDKQASMFLLRTIGKRRGYTTQSDIELKSLTAPVIQILLTPPAETKTIDITPIPPELGTGG